MTEIETLGSAQESEIAFEPHLHSQVLNDKGLKSYERLKKLPETATFSKFSAGSHKVHPANALLKLKSAIHVFVWKFLTHGSQKRVSSFRCNRLAVQTI